MADKSNFVTQAVNFTSFVSGGVDARTGIYSVSVNVGKIAGNRGIGPTLPLILRYSPLNTVYMGMGNGWTFGPTIFRVSGDSGKEPATLFLSTGEQYGVSVTGKDVAVLQQKLRTFNFYYDDKYERYVIEHKSGAVEHLTAIDGNQNVYCASAIFDAAGHKLSLTWKIADGTGNQPYPLLMQVNDDATQIALFSATYNDDGATFIFLSSGYTPGSSQSESYRVDLDFPGRLMSKIVVTPKVGSDRLQWDFSKSYHSDTYWGTWIGGMVGPGGYTESVTYSPSGRGNAYPASASQPNTLPVVTDYYRDPNGGQGTLHSTYTYSSLNFLGYQYPNLIWYNYKDSMLEMPYDGSYKYFTVETQNYVDDTGNRKRIIKRTFNAYHLQEQEDIISGTNTMTTITGYDIAPNETLDGQRAWYQSPISKSVNWNNSDQPELTSFKWDEWGNPLVRNDPDGLVTSWSYYSELGEKGDCPPDPNGFRRFVKWERVDPTGVKGDWITQSALIQQTNYTYATAQAVSTWPSNKAPILKNSATHISGTSINNGEIQDAVTLAAVTYHYWPGAADQTANTDPLNAGRLYEQISTHYANDGSNSTFDTVEQFEYEYLGSNDPDYPYGLRVTHSLQATGVPNSVDRGPVVNNNGDGKTLTVHDVHTASVFTGRVWHKEDSQGNKTTYQYDGLGRQLVRTMDPKLNYENVLTYEYSIDKTGKLPFQVTQKDVKNNKVRYTMDGMGRQYKKEVNDVDHQKGGSKNDDSDIVYTLSTAKYDGIGRPWVSTVCDYSIDENNLSNVTNHSLTKTLQYDDWGNVRLATHDDGTVENTVLDPIAKTVKQWGSSSLDDTAVTGAYLTHYNYNYSRKPYRVERYPYPSSTSAYSIRSSQYDGLYRLRAETDERGNTTQYDYDDWGRLTKTTLPVVSPDSASNVVVRAYSPDSPEKRVVDIQVTTKPGDETSLVSVGTRIFDALGRVHKKTVGGRVWQNKYPNDFDTRPTYVIDPSGATRTYAYIPELGEMINSVSVSGIQQNYQYFDHIGVLQSASVTNGPTWTYTTRLSGRLGGETDENGRSMSYAYTVAGAPHIYTHIDGTVQTIVRDKHGRIDNVTDGQVTVTAHYDKLGRLDGWQAANGSHTLTTDLGGYKLGGSLDAYGRETNRTIKDSASNYQLSLSQIWTKNDLLYQRVRGGGIVETYTYDARNRLTTWDGDQSSAAYQYLPLDRYGKKIVKQTFTLDSLNNITKVVTQFVDDPNKWKTSTGTTTFTYDYASADPCQLQSGNNDSVAQEHGYPKAFTPTYNQLGQMETDGMGELTFTYDALGRVQTAASSLTGLSGTYGYDAHNRLCKQQVTDGQNDPVTQFYYRATGLVNLLQVDRFGKAVGDGTRLFRSAVGGALAQANTGSEQGTLLLGTNNLGSVISVSDGSSTPVERIYTPYGEEQVNKAAK